MGDVGFGDSCGHCLRGLDWFGGGLDAARSGVTGARRAELAALQWTDVADGVLTIDSAIEIDRRRGKVALADAPTKTANRRRLNLDAATLVATVDSLLGQVQDTSPYAEVNRFMLNFSKNALATGGNPADVGAAIVAAVCDPASPLHVTVGADTEVFLDVWKNTGTFESFSAAMAEMLAVEA